MSPFRTDLLVIGGGWSGLSAAWYALQNGQRVVLLEAAPSLGGRARSVAPRGLGASLTHLDNGQHILVSACREIARLLDALGLDLKACFAMRPFEIHTATERIALSHWKQVFSSVWHRKALKEALSLAIFSTPWHRVSKSMVWRLAKTIWWSSLREAALPLELWLPRVSLSELLPSPFLREATRRQLPLQVHARQRVLQIRPTMASSHDSHWQVQTATHRWETRKLVMATPAATTRRLLQGLEPSFPDIPLAPSPIGTLYLYYPAHTTPLEHPLFWLGDSNHCFLIDRSFSGQPGLFAISLSGSAAVQFSAADLLDTLQPFLQTIHPVFSNRPSFWKYIVEKQGGFLCEEPGLRQRPSVESPYPHLFLCGDWTQTHYPATLEGAVSSGRAAALSASKLI